MTNPDDDGATGRAPDRLAEALRTEYERQRDAAPPQAWSTIAPRGSVPVRRRRNHPLLAVMAALLFIVVPAMYLGILPAPLPQSASTSQDAAGAASAGVPSPAVGYAEASRSAADQLQRHRDVAASSPTARAPATVAGTLGPDSRAVPKTADAASAWGIQQLDNGMSSSGWPNIVTVDGTTVTATAGANPPTYTVHSVQTRLRGTVDAPFLASTQMGYTATEQITLRRLPARVLLLLAPTAEQQRIVGMFAVNGDLATQVWPRRTRVPATFTLGDLHATIAATDGDRPPEGLTIPFSLYTHCGIDGFRFGGRWYARDGGKLSDPQARAQGWPDQASGTMAFAGDHATFTDPDGRRETFTIGELPTRTGCL